MGKKADYCSEVILGSLLRRADTASSRRFVNQQEVKKILRELDDAAEQGIDVRELKDKVVGFNKMVKAERRRQTMLQIQKSNASIARLERMEEQLKDWGNKGLFGRETENGPIYSMIADLTGVVFEGKGTKNSADAAVRDLQQRLVINLAQDLEKSGLLPFFNSKDPDVELRFAEELQKLNTPGSGAASKTPEGQMATIVHRHIKMMRERMGKAGVPIHDLEGYISNQTHERSLLMHAKQEGWIEYVMPRLDVERTLGYKAPPEKVREFLKDAYDALVTGVRKNKRVGPEGIRARSPANMAEKLGSERVIHFKGAKDFVEYNAKFGTRTSIMESTWFSMFNNAQRLALIERYGPNPEATFLRMVDHLKKKHRGNPAVVARLNQAMNPGSAGMAVRGLNLRAIWNNLDGSAYINANSTIGGFDVGRSCQNVRDWISMSRLGMATISSVTDYANAARVMQRHGAGVVDSYARSFANTFASMSMDKDVQAQFGHAVDTYVENLTGGIVSHFSRVGEPISMVKTMRLFYKLNGLQWWTNTHKMGVASALSNNLYVNKDKAFSTLPEAMRKDFEAFDIDEKMWDVIRQSGHDAGNGRGYIATNSLDGVDDAALAKQLGVSEKVTIERDGGSYQVTNPEIGAFRERAASAINKYFAEIVNEAVLTPGARERSMQNWGLQRGTAMGEFARFTMMFRAFPLTFMLKSLGAELYRGGKADMMGVAQLMIMTTALGYVAMAAKSYMKGQVPRPLMDDERDDTVTPWNEKTLTAAFLQGGGLGIYGDFLFGSYNQFGRGAMETALGPVLGGLTNDIGRLYSDIKDTAVGEKELGDTAADVVKTARNYIPFGTLPILGPALNYLLVYNLQEASSPGYLRRMERRMKEQTDVQWLEGFAPSEVIK